MIINKLTPKNKKGRFAALWIFVGSFFFLFLIALIEPLKDFLEVALDGLSCATTTDNFILPVCLLVRGGVVLFIGVVLFFVIKWVYDKSVEK